MGLWQGTGLNICKRELLAPFEAEGLVIAALIAWEGFSGWSPVPCQQATRPTADYGKSPISGAWFLQKNIDLTLSRSVKQHTQGTISPMGRVGLP